jgi:hypothetical protein
MPADTASKIWDELLDRLSSKDSESKIMSGGPDKTGQWIVVVEYIHDEWCSAKLNLHELREWRKRATN